MDSVLREKLMQLTTKCDILQKNVLIEMSLGQICGMH
jgi:hypothetical protein